MIPGCATDTHREPSPIQFTDLSAAVGLDFTHVSGTAEQRLIIESMGGGAAFLDYDSDGYLDAFVVDGTRVHSPPPQATNRLYRNIPSADGTWRRFQQVTEAAGLRRSGWGMGVAVGDYDSDGHEDLYVTYWGPNQLYHNDGRGTFTDVTGLAGGGDPRWGTSAAFGDLDADGDLDLYVANYVAFDLTAPPNAGEPCTGYKGLDVFCGPDGLESQADVLYRNDGMGGFSDVSEQAGVSAHRHPGLGVLFADIDDDGDQDLFVANDSRPNLLFRNDGDWQLTELATQAGVAYSEDGRAQAGMGVAAGDYDRDGDLDLYVTNFSDDVNTLYQNRGDGTFVDATFTVSLGGRVRPFLGWSTSLFDADNDGWLDLFVANGHLYPQLETRPSGLRYAQRNLLYRNEGGTFALLPESALPGGEQVSRGAAFGDYDNDGDTDLLVMNLNGAPTFLRNDSGDRNNWLGLELVGVTSNRDGLGARVQLFAGDRQQTHQAQRGYGYQSSHDPRLLFGLGATERVDRVEIRWPGGNVQTLVNPELRRYLVVREGVEGVVERYATTGLGPRAVPTPAAPAREEPVIGPAEHVAEQYEKGLGYYRLGRYHEALGELRGVVQRQPGNADARYALGLVLYSGLGRDDEAAAVLEPAAAQHSQRSDVRDLLGAIYLSLNRPGRAIDVLLEAAELQPDAWQLHQRLGLAYTRGEREAEAEAAFIEAARLAPYRPQPHLNLARIYTRGGRLEAARRQRLLFERWAPVEDRAVRYERQIRQSPDSPDSRCLLGQVHVEQGRLSEALDRFRQATELDSSYAKAHYGIGAVLHMGGDTQQAILAYEEAIRLDPGLNRARADLGLAYAESGRLEEAIHAYAAALRQDSTLVDARRALGLAYAARGDLGAAIEQWQAVLRQEPGTPHVEDLIRRARGELARPRSGASRQSRQK